MRRLRLAFAIVLASCSGAPRPQPAAGPAPSPTPRAALQDSAAPRATAARQGRQDTTRVRRYRDVITRAARTDSGVITVHWVGERLYFELPDSLLGRDFLLQTSVAATPSGLGAFATSGSVRREQVLTFERRGDRLLLRRVSYDNVADDTTAVSRSVRLNNLEPIVFVFEIRARNEDSTSLVFEATDFYHDDVAAISPLSAGQRTSYGVRRLDPRRTMIDYARSYPLNVEVRHTLSFDATRPPSDADAGVLTIQMQQSLILLPAVPMRARLADPRVGFFSVTQNNFGLDEEKAASQTFIRRWRLEPSDPAAYARGELVDPVTPIVYYIDPATPPRWRAWVRRGIEAWQPAFEAAGFRRAIVARDAPDDSTWTPEDIRYHSVRWSANLTRNAIGPSTSDPRTGEIIDSDVLFFHNHLRSYRNRLLIETAAANPAARTLDMPDSLLGTALQAVIAHEVGHAIGLPHNMGASYAYDTDSLRSGPFTQRWGLTPTIMDYARQNYVAQPGDTGIRFIRMLGPYDSYVVNWGYRVIPQARTAEDERPVLDRWIREHEGDPRYRYGAQRGGAPVDPGTQTEDLGSDPVRSSGYGIANLRRVVPNLVPWTTTAGEDYDDLQEIYGELLGIWGLYTNHVISLVGGVRQTNLMSDQAGMPFEPVTRAEQAGAVAFLVREVFRTPDWLVPEDILRRIEHAGAVERVRALQASRLGNLIDPQRLQRLIEQEAFDPGNSYTLANLFDDLRRGIWTELTTGRTPDVYRRDLQRVHLRALEVLLTQEPNIPPASTNAWRTPVRVADSDIRAMSRAELVTLRAAAARRTGTGDRIARAHYQDVVARIDAMLNP